MGNETSELIKAPSVLAPETDDKRYRRLGWIVLLLFIGIFGIWGSFAPLSSAIPAPGKVIVASSNQVIQHLEGGIVKAIHVSEGDKIKAGELLIELDETQSKAQLDIALMQYYENLAIEARLLAERDNTGLRFPKELMSMEESSKKEIILEGQKREFTARQNQFMEEKKIYLQRIEQLNSQINGLKAIIESKSDLSYSYKEEIKEWETLYAQQLIDKMRLRDIQREKMKIDGEIANARADISRAQSQIGENKAQILNQKQTFTKEVVAQLSEVQAKLNDLNSRILALKDTLSRTKLVSPQDGVVTNLQVHTISGVIPPGQLIMEIVPSNEPLIVEGKIAANEAVNIREGLEAEIRFPSFAHVKTLNIVEGKVIYIAADAVMDEKAQFLYYPVKVQVSNAGKEELSKNHLVLQSGMPADVMIVLSSRTFSDYLIKPFKNMMSKAFNEQ